MSLSEPRLKNPASKFISWSGSKGKFNYFDKALESKIFIEDPIYIIPLDELSTIKGFHDDSQSGIYSNEVKNLSKEILIVKSFKGGLIANGLYKDIKGQLEGGNFAKSVYAALITPQPDKSVELELINLSFYGSSLGAWIDAKVQVDSGNIIILNSSADELKKGITVYFAPKIVKSNIRKDIIERCVQMDKNLQSYLESYFGKSIEETETITESQSINQSIIEQTDDLPF